MGLLNGILSYARGSLAKIKAKIVELDYQRDKLEARSIMGTIIYGAQMVLGEF